MSRDPPSTCSLSDTSMDNSQAEVVSAPPPPGLLDMNADQFNESIMGDPSASQPENSTAESELTDIADGQQEDDNEDTDEEEEEEIVIGADVCGPPDLPVKSNWNVHCTACLVHVVREAKIRRFALK